MLLYIKVGRNVAILWKRGLLLDWYKLSLQIWTKNTATKFHRLWDKLLQWVKVSLCDKPP
jgi:hypothetical protein